MRHHGLAGLLLLPAALAAVLVRDVLWPRVRAAGRGVAAWPPVARLHAGIGRLPPVVALPLFLVPEACSRLGWVVSAWLLIQGHGWRALAVYAASKLFAGSLALWICSACLPALLRVRAFAAAHRMAMQGQRWLLGWAQRRGGGRFGAVMAGVRARWLRAGSSAAAPVPATPSAPGGPSLTG